jgi:predicted transglutaminase-like cysteine proteinase
MIRRDTQRHCRLLILLALVGTVLSAGAATYSLDTPDEFLTRADDYLRWSNLMQRHAQQAAEIDACLADAARCPVYLRGYREIVTRSQSLSAYRRMLLTNRFINSRHWRVESGSRDNWRTLTEFLRDGGDCEDYAIAKYFVLRRLGFDTADLRIGIGREIATRDYHAVTMVRLDGRVYLLDVDGEPSRHLSGYQLLFSINEDAIWDHQRPRAKQEGNRL